MQTLLIFGVILLAIAIVAYGFACLKDMDADWHKMLATLIMMCSFWGMCFIFEVEKMEVYRKTVRGNPPYRMEITYQLKDSVYVPKDTTYIKVK